MFPGRRFQSLNESSNTSAGYPGLYLVSHEEQRVEGEFKGIAKEIGFRLHVWSATIGLLDVTSKSVRDCNDPLAMLLAVPELPKESILLLRDNKPNSNRSRCPLSSSKHIEPIVVRVAPKRWISMARNRWQMRRVIIDVVLQLRTRLWPEAGLDMMARLERGGSRTKRWALECELYPLVMKIARSHLPRRTDEEDLVQIVFAKIFAHVEQYSGAEPAEHWGLASGKCGSAGTLR